MKNCKIDILGVRYEIKLGLPDEFPSLNDSRGFVDPSTKLIVVANYTKNKIHETGTQRDLDYVMRKILRHEIVHAFLYESGLYEQAPSCNCWATNEEMIDWFALQYPKIKKVYEKLGIEE